MVLDSISIEKEFTGHTVSKRRFELPLLNGTEWNDIYYWNVKYYRGSLQSTLKPYLCRSIF